MQPIVLRYSNYEAETAHEHNALIRTRGAVWWGWWKKLHEPVLTDALLALESAIADGEQPIIGLANRADHDFFEAVCVGVRFTSSNGVLASPNGELTPAYYRERPCAAWFKLVAIRFLDPTTWAEKFGEVPVGDRTFFWATRGQVDAPKDRITVPGSGILHISDLHFGDDYGYSRGNSTTRSNDLDEMIAEACTVPPAAVVISGDITTRGDANGFTAARVFIERLLEKLRLTSDSLIVVPGNHDIHIRDSSPTRSFEIEQQYRDFLELIYGRKTEIERLHWLRDSRGTNYLIAAVNSARPRSRATMDYGYVGSDRSEPVLRSLRDARTAVHAGDPAFSALVLHHHILPATMLEHPDEERPISLTLDAGELVSLCQKYEIDAIFHGHQHLPFIARTGRVVEFGEYASSVPDIDSGVWVLGAGSAGVATHRLCDEMRYNALNLYKLEAGYVNATVMEFSPRIRPRVKFSVNLPLATGVAQ